MDWISQRIEIPLSSFYRIKHVRGYFLVGASEATEFPKLYFPRVGGGVGGGGSRRMKIAVRVRDSWGSASLTVVITIMESYLVEVVDRLEDTLVYT